MSSIGYDGFAVEGPYSHFVPSTSAAPFDPRAEFCPGEAPEGWEDFDHRLASYAGASSPEFEGSRHGADVFAAAFGDQSGVVSRGEDGVHHRAGGAGFDHRIAVNFDAV